jgi:hypothetical protein
MKTDKIEILKEKLKTEEVKVKFTKKNGEVREMLCTTDLDSVPTFMHPSTETNREPNKEVARVFDIDLQQWRSFRFDSVISFDT